MVPSVTNWICPKLPIWWFFYVYMWNVSFASSAKTIYHGIRTALLGFLCILFNVHVALPEPMYHCIRAVLLGFLRVLFNVGDGASIYSWNQWLFRAYWMPSLWFIVSYPLSFSACFLLMVVHVFENLIFQKFYLVLFFYELLPLIHILFR